MVKQTIELSPNVRRDVAEGDQIVFDVNYSSVVKPTITMLFHFSIFESPFKIKQSPLLRLLEATSKASSRTLLVIKI